jgi:SAM-dependent methyltransferase
MSDRPEDKVEILSVGLLDQQRRHVTGLKKLARSLRLEFGWHYLLDMTWILSQLGEVRGKRIMDAGAGTGILQWYLAEQGATVISVDRVSRAALPLRFRSRYHVRGLREQDLLPSRQVVRANFARPVSWQVKMSFQARDLAGMTSLRRVPGKVFIYNQDLKNLEDIPSNSLDAVVAVSALEHNSPEDLSRVVSELLRVLKPEAILAASLNAARDQDWWHEPSNGWCYTANSLRRLFCLLDDLPTNYDHYDELFAALRDCSELYDNLASFYYRSGQNGMPWGKWDPQYIPVGVRKVK